MANYDPIHLTFNDKPQAILNGMSNLLRSRQKVKETHQRRKWIPWLLVLGSFPLILIDLGIRLLGYNVCIFSFAAPVFWLAALIMGIAVRRSRQVEIPPLYQTGREILYTLRDDILPERNFFGHLDLTGAMQPNKIVREYSNALGMNIQQFRDEWLSLKAKLYDGNMLRISAAERNKVRKGYHKRSAISGKNKWKPPKYKGNEQELKVRLSVNPEIYEIVPTNLQPGTQIGAYSIDSLDTSGGIISITASAFSKTVSSKDVLSVLRTAYDLLQRKG